jgi:hypothetical protein
MITQKENQGTKRLPVLWFYYCTKPLEVILAKSLILRMRRPRSVEILLNQVQASALPIPTMCAEFWCPDL